MLTKNEAQQLCEEREFAMKVKEKLDKEKEMSALVRLLDLGGRYNNLAGEGNRNENSPNRCCK